MKTHIEDLNHKLKELQEKKKNNLIFNGIPHDSIETEDDLKANINSILRNNLRFRRDIVVTSVTREMDGPMITGAHPVVVTFLRFQEKEKVLKKAGLDKSPHYGGHEHKDKREQDAADKVHENCKDEGFTS